MANNNDNGDGTKWKFLAVISAIVAGLYFFGGKDASKRREKAKEQYRSVSKNAGKTMERAKKNISKAGYYKTIEEVLLKYKDRAKNISREELGGLRDELQNAWQDIEDETEDTGLEERSRTRTRRK